MLAPGTITDSVLTSLPRDDRQGRVERKDYPPDWGMLEMDPMK